MTKEQEKFKIISKLINDEAPKDIANELEVPYTKVLRFKKEYEQSVIDGQVGELIDLDQVMRDELLNQVQEGMPSFVQEQAGEVVSEIKAKLTTLDALGEDLQVTAAAITKKIKSMAMSIDHVSELESLSTALCSLQNAFFNKNSTQVNVQNNYTEDAKAAYGDFLSDKPANLGG